MKKTVALVLALVMTVVLCGCGSAGEPNPPLVEETPNSEVVSSQAEETSDPKNALTETEAIAQIEPLPQIEEVKTQTITEYGISIQVPEGWSWTIPKNANTSSETVYYNFTEINGDSSKTLQISFIVSDLFSSRSYNLSDSEKYQIIGTLMQSFDSPVTDIKCSKHDNTYIGSGTFFRSSCEGRITVVADETVNVIVTVAALEALEFSAEYEEDYERVIDSIVFS